MCCLLVSGFLTEITQQIHSLRASGVISSHFASAAGSEMRTFRRSAGTVCTAPAEIARLAIDFILHRYAISPGILGSCSDWTVEKCQFGAWGKDSFALPGLGLRRRGADGSIRASVACLLLLEGRTPIKRKSAESLSNETLRLPAHRRRPFSLTGKSIASIGASLTISSVIVVPVAMPISVAIARPRG